MFNSQKGGASMKEEKENKIYRIQVRLDQFTYDNLQKIMKTSRGSDQSKLIRKAINECKVEDIKSKGEIIAQLKRIGTNLNQVIQRINAGIIDDPGIIAAEFKKVNLQLDKALDKLYK